MLSEEEVGGDVDKVVIIAAALLSELTFLLQTMIERNYNIYKQEEKSGYKFSRLEVSLP